MSAATRRTKRQAAMPPPPSPAVAADAQRDPATRRGTRRSNRDQSVGSISSLQTAGTASFPTPRNLSAVAEQIEQPASGAAGTSAQLRSSVAPSESSLTSSQRVVRPKLMQMFLPRLLNASDDLFKHLREPQADAAFNAELEAIFRPAFDTYREIYADTYAPFINPAVVLSNMGLAEESPEWYKTSKILCTANLATLLDDLVHFDGEGKAALDTLQSWDMNFPGTFIPHLEPVHEWMSGHDTFGVALQIRTQRLLTTLYQLDDVDPFKSVAEIFCEQDAAGDDPQKYLEQDGDSLQLRPLADFDLNPDLEPWRGRYVEQLKRICSVLSSEQDFAANLAKLESTYTTEEMREALRLWTVACFDHVKMALQDNANAAPAASAYDGPVDPGLFANSAVQGVIPSTPSSGGNFLSNLSAVQALKKLGQTQQTVISDQDIVRRAHELASSNYPESSIGLDASQGLPSNGEGLLYPEPIENGPTPSFPPPSASYKRPGTADDDDAFETDDRVPKAGRRKAARPAKRARKAAASAQDAQDAAVQSSPAAPSQSSYIPRSSHGIELDEPDFQALSQRAKEIAAANRKPKEPQVRTPWDRQDLKLLTKAVETYKCKWSAMEKDIKEGHIPFKYPRDQQALRDKARLLKQDFLKTDSPLPAGFDLVVLGKKERNAIIACGKNPDRKEADVGVDGMAINTEYDDMLLDLAPPGALHPSLQQDPQLEEQLPTQPGPEPELEPQPEQEQHQEAVAEAAM